MLKSTLVAAMIALSPLAGAAQGAPEGPLEQVISDQLSAFLADDFATAFTFASPNIQRIFGTSDRFGQMVRDGYPMVWRPADVTFLDSRTVAGTEIQRVMIRDRSGRAHLLDYQMIPGDGGWKINGVRILEVPGAGV